MTPTRAGQLVVNQHSGLGITTDAPRKRTPQIAVQFVGGPYPVLAQVADLTVVPQPLPSPSQ